MLSKLKAFLYAVFHPAVLDLTILRRYVDAKANFIGELYLDGKMIGMSCDSLPYGLGALQDGVVAIVSVRFDLDTDFTVPMPVGTVRVGGNTPEETKAVRQMLLRRRYCQVRWHVRNAFIEHILEKDIVR